MKISIDQPPSPEPPPFPPIPAIVENEHYIVLALGQPYPSYFSGPVLARKHEGLNMFHVHDNVTCEISGYRPFRGSITLSNDEQP